MAVVGATKVVVNVGAVEILGGRLACEVGQEYKLYCPASHAIPPITGLDDDNQVTLIASYSGIRDFFMISETFAHVFDVKSSSSLSIENRDHKPSFGIIGHHIKVDRRQQKSLVPFQPSAQWLTTVESIRTSKKPSNRPVKALICGPKNSGKSTMTRYLTNTFLSSNPPPTNAHWSSLDGVAVLDIDPGQPEFGPPGTISLAHIRSLLLGPSYTHPLQHAPLNAMKDAIIHQHFLGSTTPSASPASYFESVLNLVAKYKRIVELLPNCHLIINTPGWITGNGLEILTSLFREIQPTDLIHMSANASDEFVDRIKTYNKPNKAVLHFIINQTSPSGPSAASLRQMSLQSYLHLHTARTANNIRWNVRDILELPNLRLQYTGRNKTLHGVICLEREIYGQDLQNYLTGMMVGIVVLDNATALDPMTIDGEDSDSMLSDPTTIDSMSSTSLSDPHPSLRYPRTMNFGHRRTVGINPWMSRCLGLGYVTSLTPENRTISLCSPVIQEEIERVAVEENKIVVLVTMIASAPEWLRDEKRHLQIRDCTEASESGHPIQGMQRGISAQPKDVYEPDRMNAERPPNAVNPFQAEINEYTSDREEE